MPEKGSAILNSHATTYVYTCPANQTTPLHACCLEGHVGTLPTLIDMSV